METKVVLDTTVLIDFVRDKEEAISLVEKLKERFDIFTTDINIFELYYGAEISGRPKENRETIKGLLNNLNILSTTHESVEISAKILADLNKKGQTIEIKDILVAGICLSNSIPIVTSNKKHFERMNVKIFDG